jgi:hypothetical protein
VMGFFETGAHEQFAWAGTQFQLWSFWSLPPELVLQGDHQGLVFVNSFSKLKFTSKAIWFWTFLCKEVLNYWLNPLCCYNTIQICYFLSQIW